METKPFFSSKELYVVFFGILNLAFSKYGLPSIEPSPELYSALLIVMGVLRAFYTEAKLSFK